MRLFRTIVTTFRLWFSMRHDGYSFRDCYNIAADIIDDAIRFKNWKRYR